MPRPHLQIEVEGETPIRIIISPDRENEDRFFNVLAPARSKGKWDWVDIAVGLTDDEVLERLAITLRRLVLSAASGRE